MRNVHIIVIEPECYFPLLAFTGNVVVIVIAVVSSVVVFVVAVAIGVYVWKQRYIQMKRRGM